ncbi:MULTISPECIES: MFS transporter [unclassified Janibacter]|uniref:MFS transporter n=1 Tax=unclassified Janibacter TaxID=2649294 RepID=UPI003CFE2692
MILRRYRDVLAIPEVRMAVLLGLLLRTPLAASFIVLTLHVVDHLGRTYGAAGAVSAASTIALAVSGPWRGRRLDKVGLRTTFAPSLIVGVLVWCVAPFVGYWALIVAVIVAGLMAMPVWAVLRQVILAATPVESRRTALSVDSVATEMSFMIGPAVGVLAATTWDTRWVLLAANLLVLLGGFALWLLNPRLSATPPESAAQSGPAETAPVTAAGAPAAAGAGVDEMTVGDEVHEEKPAKATPARVPTRSWLGPAAAGVLGVTAASTLVLSGTDVSIVALMREQGLDRSIAWVMAFWALGSLLGALVYGALPRSLPGHWLLALLGLATVPVGLAEGAFWACVLVMICGFLCAPTLTATTEQISHLVPERVRGEALGWHGSAITSGSAFGAPIAGVAIDASVPAAGFAAVGATGVVIALLAQIALSRRDRRR